MPTQKYRVHGLQHGDEAPLAAELRRLDGVIFVLLNHEDECAEVEFDDDRIGPFEVAQALRSRGHAVSLAG